MAKVTAIEARALNKVMINPVKWAQIFVSIFDNATKKNTPWVARWYQAEMLLDDSTKKVARCGRRTGKCLPGDAEVVDWMTGESLPIKTLYNRQRARCGTMLDDYKIVEHFTNIILDNGIKDIFEIKTESGRSVRATGNHPFFTIDGWKDVDNLKIGESLAVASETMFFGDNDIDRDLIEFIAYVLSYGICREDNIEVNCRDSIDTDMFRFLCIKLSIKIKELDGKIILDKKEKSFSKFLIQNKIKEDIDKHTIPREIYKLNKDKLLCFLNCMRDFNSEKLDDENFYIFKTEGITKKMQHLLLRFGTNSYIDGNALRIVSKDKDVVPQRISKNIIISSVINGNGVPFDLSNDFRKEDLRDIGYEIQDEDITNIADSKLLFEKIISINYVGAERTYDFSIPITNNFIVNDFISHNTETMCIEILWKAYTKPYHRILVVTPYENQVRLIFTRLMEIVNDSPFIKQKLVKSTKNPYWIEFDNNAIILGFTTGASSGSGGASIRGQRADAIYLDEVDYMTDADFDSVMAIGGERPDITIKIFFI